MRDDRLWVISFAFAVALGCGSEIEHPSIDDSEAGRRSDGGLSGAPSNGGGAGAPTDGGSGGSGAGASGGTLGAPVAGGTGGSSSNDGGSNVGATTSGGVGGGGVNGGGVGGSGVGGGVGGSKTSGGASAGGSGGRGGGGRAGAPSTGGTSAGSGGMPADGGTGGCVPNLACKLDPPPSTGDIHQDCVDRINQFRVQCACLPPLERRLDGEACADQMAEYDAGKGMAHAGARDRICQPGGSQNECPGYRSTNQVISLCLQQMWDEGPPPMQPCEGDCFQKHGHFINMTSTSSTKVACGFFTTPSGQVWAVQNFTR